MVVFEGNFIIRTSPCGARMIMESLPGAEPEAFATVTPDDRGDLVLEAVRVAIVAAGGRLTDESSRVILAGGTAEEIAAGVAINSARVVN